MPLRLPAPTQVTRQLDLVQSANELIGSFLAGACTPVLSDDYPGGGARQLCRGISVFVSCLTSFNCPHRARLARPCFLLFLLPLLFISGFL